MVPATLQMMAIRTLCGALILLFLTAPLTASLCGSCAQDRCELAQMAGMSGPGKAAAEDSMTEDHCSATMKTTGQSAPCPSVTSLAGPGDCCSISTAPDPEATGVPAISASYGFVLKVVLEPVGSVVVPVVQAHWMDRDPHKALQPAPQPLYTLHSAFLI